MKESARAALSWVRAHSNEWNIDPELFKSSEIHLHVPSGAIPKDGPSAGVTMTTALVSALSRRPVRGDVSMTGEITLSGKVLPATELHRMGIVDVLATDGQGETAVRNWIAKNAKRRNGMQAVFNARQFIHPITREELDGIVNLWVDAALRLTDRDLKMMARLVRAQSRRLESSGVTPLEPVEAAVAA